MAHPWRTIFGMYRYRRLFAASVLGAVLMMPGACGAGPKTDRPQPPIDNGHNPFASVSAQGVLEKLGEAWRACCGSWKLGGP